MSKNISKSTQIFLGSYIQSHVRQDLAVNVDLPPRLLKCVQWMQLKGRPGRQGVPSCQTDIFTLQFFHDHIDSN